MPRRVPTAVDLDAVIEIDGNRYIIVARDPHAPHLLHLYDPAAGARWPLDPATDAPVPFDIARANLDGRPWRYLSDPDAVADMVELVLESELILDPAARETAEARLAIVVEIRAHRRQLLAVAREHQARRRAALGVTIALAGGEPDRAAGGEPDRAAAALPADASAVRATLDRYCDARHGISVDTYYRWERELNEAGGSVVGLLHAREGTGPGSRSRSAHAGARLTEEQNDLVQWAYEHHYRRNPNKKRSLTFAHAMLVQRAEELGQAPVGLGTLWACFIGAEAGQRQPNGEPPRHRAARKEEAETSRAYYETIWNTAKLPGEYVFEDSHLLDFVGVDERYRLPMPRLWLHVLFDAFSGCVSGLNLTMQGPGTQTLQTALMHSVFPRDLEAEFGVAAVHPFMTPQHLVVDNAWGYHSHSLRAACNDIGRYGVNPITIVFRTPYDARRGALIERFFGKLETELIHHLRGTTLSNPQELGDNDPAARAALLFEDILWAIVRYLDIYHNTPQRRLLNRTPLQRYREGADRLGRMPQPNDSRARLLFRVLDPRPRVVDRQGFKLWGLRFNAHCLDPYRSSARTKDRPRIHLRYDEDDIRHVSAYADGKYLGEVPCLNLPMRADGLKATALRHWNSVKELGAREVPDGKGGTRRIAVSPSAMERARLFNEVEKRAEQRAKEAASARRELERQRVHPGQGKHPAPIVVPPPPAASPAPPQALPGRPDPTTPVPAPSGASAPAWRADEPLAAHQDAPGPPADPHDAGRPPAAPPVPVAAAAAPLDNDAVDELIRQERERYARRG